MKRYEFHSALPPEEVMDRLRRRTRPWSTLDGWTARSTWFLREGGLTPLRLIRTARVRSYVFADLTVTGNERGAEITVLTDVAKTMCASDIAVAFFLVLVALLRVCLTGSFLGALEVLIRYGWILPVMLWAGSLTRRELPELTKFVEDNLLE